MLHDAVTTYFTQRVFKIAYGMPMEAVQRCWRQTREHELSYAALLSMNEKNEDLKFNDIEKMEKEINNKRCTMDQDYSLIKKMVDAINVDIASKDVGKDVKVIKFDFIKKSEQIFYSFVSITLTNIKILIYS